MTLNRRWTTFSQFTLALCLAFSPCMARAQAGASTPIQNLELIAGRSFPITGETPISKVTVANPAIADVVVISETEVVINAVTPGSTDIILWGSNVARRHYRVIVRSSPERRQVLLGVKFAEVRKDALRQIGTSLMYRPSPGTTRVGTGLFNSDNAITSNGSVTLPTEGKFATVLSNFNSRELLGLLELEEQRGNSRTLAEPNLMAANGDTAYFLAGGELPIPIVQGGNTNGITIVYRRFGIQMKFRAEVLSDSLIKLYVVPSVSSLDYANAVTLSGFRIPAFRIDSVETTVDVLQNRSLIISGLFNEEREQVKTGLPFLSSIPILGDLFSSQRWLKHESELIVVVTPVIMDPNNPRAADLLKIVPDSLLPAGQALQKRLPPAPTKPPR